MCHVGCMTAANAQSSFTQRLQQSKNGEGKVTITQDKAIDDLVNGPKTTLAVTSRQKAQRASPHHQPDQKTTLHNNLKSHQTGHSATYRTAPATAT